MASKILQVVDLASIPYDQTIYNGTAVNADGQPFWLEFVTPFFDEIGVGVEFLPIHKINKDKKWIINIDINGWNWYPTKDTDVFESFGPEILKELNEGNAYLIINHQCESHTNYFFTRLYQKMIKFNSIPYNKIIYMVGAADVEREYRNFVEENNIPKEQQISVIYTHHVYKRFHVDGTFQNIGFFEYDRTVKKEKKFLSLNRKGHDHRVLLVSALVSAGLVDHGYVSLGVFPKEIPVADHQIHNLTMDEINFEYIKEGFAQIKDQLPLQIDDTNLDVNLFQANSLPINFYQKSCFSLVSSTCGLKHQEKSVGFTEKEVRPILARHPFIIYNLPGALTHLRSMGYLTFEPWFDESYDLETNDRKRLEKIIKEVARLSAISFEDWEVMLDEMRPVLEHNYNRMVNYNNEQCYFNSDLKKLLYYVS